MNRRDFLHIYLDKVSAKGFQLAENLEENWLNSLLLEPKHPFSWKAKGASFVELTLLPEGNLYALKGTIEGEFLYPCVRCLQTTQYKVQLSLDLKLLEGEDPEVSEMANGIDLEEEELMRILEEPSVYYYKGKVVDLEPIIREELFLSLPVFPVCVEETFCEFQPLSSGELQGSLLNDAFRSQLLALKKEGGC